MNLYLKLATSDERMSHLDAHTKFPCKLFHLKLSLNVIFVRDKMVRVWDGVVL